MTTAMGPLGPRALAVRKWVERCGGQVLHEGVLREFIDRRGCHPDDLRDAIAELEEAGLVGWADVETLELIEP